MSEITEQVGRMIRNARKEKGLTQKELGEIMGLSESAINKYEAGKQNLTVETLQNVANALGVKFNLGFER